MNSFLFSAAVPPHEIHLLPIRDVRSPIRAARTGLPVSGAGRGWFVTDWQLHDGPRPGSRSAFGGDEDEDVGLTREGLDGTEEQAPDNPGCHHGSDDS